MTRPVPITKLGTPSPITATPCPTSSESLPGLSAPRTPKPTPMQEAEHEGHDPELERHRQRPPDQRRHGLLSRERDAEVARQGGVEPGGELLEGGLADAVEMVQRGELSLCQQPGADAHRRRDGVPGQQAQDDEDDDRDAEERDDHAREAPDDACQERVIPRIRTCAACRPSWQRQAARVGSAYENVVDLSDCRSRFGGSVKPLHVPVRALRSRSCRRATAKRRSRSGSSRAP